MIPLVLLLALAAPPLRDPFQFVDETRPQQKAQPKKPPKAVTPPPVAQAEAPHLVALLRGRSTGVRAALSFGTEVVLCVPGAQLQGFEVLSIDEDAGVRLRGPDGLVITLPPQ